ncbi:THO complex subunit 4B-like isoform X1 [Tripterygium wilfordii]|uniref:THO complex subunit 4B-like isoform X1 n=1 Tax=Tripterygium wilfordii TaxID=458696 RepID=UPI0018F7FFFC|nr:THO complex subunit 4B-like isoform X1 [Tripterygium wilfordii]
MSRSLDKALDDITRSGEYNATSGSRRSSGPGHDRWLPSRDPTRWQPYAIPSAVLVPEPVRQQQEVLASESSKRDSGTRLYLSNLDYDVSNTDIKVLFSDVGVLKSYGIHYDRTGRSVGTAEVVFLRQTDALAAISKYNNHPLDGKPLKIELVGNLIGPAPLPPTTHGILGTPSELVRSDGGAGFETSIEGIGGGFARSEGKRTSDQEKLSAEDLDADLEKYHQEAKRIKASHS